MAPTRLAETAIFSEANRNGAEAGSRSFQNTCPGVAFQVRIRSSCIRSGLLSPVTIPTTTGKKLRYALMIALGRIPDRPSEFSTTMIIGAMARIGMVWLAMAQGITLMSIARLWTIPTASAIPATVPMAKPSSVALSVTQA